MGLVPGTPFWKGSTLPGQLALRQVGKVGLTYSESHSGVWSARPVGTMAGRQSRQTPCRDGSTAGLVGSLFVVGFDSRPPRLHRGCVPGTVMSQAETDYGSRLPGQLALRQVGKVGRTVPCHVQEFGRPGQLALWQVGKAGKSLHDLSIADPVRVVDFRRVNSRPGPHRGYVLCTRHGHVRERSRATRPVGTVGR